jgi:hypothetical protein
MMSDNFVTGSTVHMRGSSAVDPMAATNQKDFATATLAGALGIDEASLAKAFAAIAIFGSSQPVGARYLDEEDAARYLKTSRRRLKDLRTRGRGPSFVRLGACARYRTDWCDRWARENAIASTAEETARCEGGMSNAPTV